MSLAPFLSTASEVVRPQVITADLGAQRHAMKPVMEQLAGLDEMPHGVVHRIQKFNIRRMQDFVGVDPRKILGTDHSAETRNIFTNWLEGYCLSVKDRFPSPAPTEPVLSGRRGWMNFLRALHK